MVQIIEDPIQTEKKSLEDQFKKINSILNPEFGISNCQIYNSKMFSSINKRYTVTKKKFLSSKTYQKECSEKIGWLVYQEHYGIYINDADPEIVKGAAEKLENVGYTVRIFVKVT
jgi:hypothetical protein